MSTQYLRKLIEKPPEKVEGLAEKLDRLIEKLESVELKLDDISSSLKTLSVGGITGAFEPDLFVTDINVGTTPRQLSPDTMRRDEVMIMADSANTDKVLVGNASAQTYPLVAGSVVGIQKTALNLIYVRAASGTQVVHVICGGG
jgi:hypothetical protein